jgi:transcriptional regulator with PAS, ATPase and Fis domain
MKSSINHGHVGIQMIPSIPRFSSEGVNYEEATVKIIGDIKHRILNNALEISRGNKTKAAKMLNISRYKFIREFNKTANHSK